MLISDSKFLTLCFYITLTFCDSYSANILVMSPFPYVSHNTIMQVLAKRLAERGHRVDVVSHFPLDEPLERYNDISIKRSSDMLTDKFNYEFAKNLVGGTLLNSIIHYSGTEICKAAFQSKPLRQLKNCAKIYDLLIVEAFGSECMLGWAWHFGVPTITVTSSIPLPWNTERFGLSNNPAYVPTYFVEYSSRMSFLEIIMNCWTLIQAKLWFEYESVRQSDRIARDFFGEKMPSLTDLAYNSSLMLINTHFSINDVRPLVPSVIEIGGLHIETPKPLNKYFNNVLDNDLKGIIYFTMGSMISTETFPLEILQNLLNTFSNLPYKVLWRTRKEKFPKDLNVPSNIHFEAWMPQLDILCDSRVKLYITHGGMMGIQEAVYCGVPVLGIPIFADQKSNVKHAELLGYGKMIKDPTKDNLLEAAQELLDDPKYAKNAKSISEEFKDRPISATETAIYWVEYVIKHKGAPRLQNGAKYLSWYQYYLIDVLAITIAVPCILTYLLTLLLKSMLRRITIKTKFKSL